MFIKICNGDMKHGFSQIDLTIGLFFSRTILPSQVLWKTWQMLIEVESWLEQKEDTVTFQKSLHSVSCPN